MNILTTGTPNKIIYYTLTRSKFQFLKTVLSSPVDALDIILISAILCESQYFLSCLIP